MIFTLTADLLADMTASRRNCHNSLYSLYHAKKGNNMTSTVLDSYPDLFVNDKQRTAKLTWTLGEGVSRDGEPCTHVTQLFVAHDKDRKQIIASAQRIDRIDYHGRMIETFAIGGGTRLQLTSVGCARYSAKALETAMDRALAELRSHAAAGHPVAVALTDPSSPA